MGVCPKVYPQGWSLEKGDTVLLVLTWIKYVTSVSSQGPASRFSLGNADYMGPRYEPVAGRSISAIEQFSSV